MIIWHSVLELGDWMSKESRKKYHKHYILLGLPNFYKKEKTIRSIREENRIIIMATHNIFQAKKLADEVIHIHDGKIVEMANTEDFFSKPKHELSQKFIKGEL